MKTLYLYKILHNITYVYMYDICVSALESILGVQAVGSLRQFFRCTDSLKILKLTPSDLGGVLNWKKLLAAHIDYVEILIKITINKYFIFFV